jgi:hypothetical protein
MKLKAISKERYRATAAQRRLYGGKTVTRFWVFRAEDRENHANWVVVDGFGPTPGERKTDAMRRAVVLLEAKGLAPNPWRRFSNPMGA